MKKIIDSLYSLPGKIFSKKIFLKFNQFLFSASLHGMGINNYENERISGEAAFINHIGKLFGNKKIIIFDVGANVGNYSVRIKKEFPRSTIFAFEPHPLTFATLTKNTQKLNIKVVNAGMGEKNAACKIYDYLDDDGSEHASMFKNVIEDIHEQKAVSHTTQVFTLDKFALDNNIKKINLLKIDTEGNELNVLRGAKQLIKNKKIDIIQFEFNEMNVVSRVFMKDYFDLLKGYDIYRLLPSELLPLSKYHPLEYELFGYQNLVAISREIHLEY